MEAGRELDALVAEKVMGWKLFRVGYCGTDDETPEQGKYEKALDRAGFDSVGWYAWTGGKVVLWEDGFTREHCFSTNIADAWGVVNHLMCLGYDDKWFFQLHYDNVELWDASFYKESTSDGGGPEMWGTADTPALAICLAALKAVSQEGQG